LNYCTSASTHVVIGNSQPVKVVILLQQTVIIIAEQVFHSKFYTQAMSKTTIRHGHKCLGWRVDTSGRSKVPVLQHSNSLPTTYANYVDSERFDRG